MMMTDVDTRNHVRSIKLDSQMIRDACMSGQGAYVLAQQSGKHVIHPVAVSAHDDVIHSHVAYDGFGEMEDQMLRAMFCTVINVLVVVTMRGLRVMVM